MPRRACCQHRHAPGARPHRLRKEGGWPVVVILLAALAACSAPPTPPIEGETGVLSATSDWPDRQPQRQVVEALRTDIAAQRHPRDGVGRAWLRDGDTEIGAGQLGRWQLVYEAAEDGIAVGGMLFLQVSPFWGWSTPQTHRPGAPGYTRVTTDAVGVALEVRTLDQQLLGITIGGRPLVAGERITIDYGADDAGAHADRYAERDSRFWLSVDGDGDGIRQLIDDAPGITVAPGSAAQMIATLTSTARPGETVRLTLAVLDAVGNAGVAYEGVVTLSATPPLAALPARHRLRLADRGVATITLPVDAEGVYRVTASTGSLTAESNPLQVAAGGAHVRWGDLQNHSNLSDGTALPIDLLRYARDVAALDVVALTDHDHWGMRFLDQEPALVEAIAEATQRLHEPGRFVTIPGYEWTNWLHGHRHVLFFDGEAALLSALDPRYDTPTALWQALEGRRAITIAHHSAGGPIATDWSIPPDPRFEPITEVVSVHGASEAMDAPIPIYRPVSGNFVRDALDRGYRLGFLGSSDGHDGHPGLGHLASPSGGLAAIFTDRLTRDGVYEALMARRVYATNGPRILMRAVLGGHRMGATIPIGADGPHPGAVPGVVPGELVVQVHGVAPLARIDVVRSGEVIGAIDCQGASDCPARLVFDDLRPNEYVYLRAVQRDEGAAWSSPWFFVAETSPLRPVSE